MTTEQFAEMLDKADLLYRTGWFALAGQMYDAVAAHGGTPDPQKHTVIAQAHRELGSGQFSLGEHRPVSIRGDQVIGTLHFTDALTPYQKMVAFKSAVRTVDIEIFKQCNRRCPYCPNSIYDRRSENEFLPETLFERVISDFAQIEYFGQINFSGYNEPLMHFDVLVERIKHARARLPNARLAIYTNGDYLTADAFNTLDAIGVDMINVSVHLAPETPYNERDVLLRIRNKADELGLKVMLHDYEPGSHLGFLATGSRVGVVLREENYEKSGSNRGGLLNDIGVSALNRQEPCIRPLEMLIVNFRGKVVPCCNMIGELPQHRGCVIGTVAEETLIDIYCSTRAVAWRRCMLVRGDKPSPCDVCAGLLRPAFTTDAQNRLEAEIAEIPFAP